MDESENQLKNILIGAGITLATTFLMYLIDRIFKRAGRKKDLRIKIFDLCERLLNTSKYIEMNTLAHECFKRCHEINGNPLNTTLAEKYFDNASQLMLRYQDYIADLVSCTFHLQRFFYIKNKRKIGRQVVAVYKMRIHSHEKQFLSCKTVADCESKKERILVVIRRRAERGKIALEIMSLRNIIDPKFAPKASKQ